MFGVLVIHQAEFTISYYSRNLTVITLRLSFTGWPLVFLWAPPVRYLACVLLVATNIHNFQLQLKTVFMLAHTKLFCSHYLYCTLYSLLFCTALDSALTGIQLYFWTSTRSKAQQCRQTFKTSLPRRVQVLPQSWGASRHKASMCYRNCSHRRLGSGDSENGATEWPGYRTPSTGSRDRAMTKVERHCRPQLHIQKLLGSMEITFGEERNFASQLGIPERTNPSTTSSHSLEQSKGRTDGASQWTIRKSFGGQQNSE
jgi:hypothetical protein